MKIRGLDRESVDALVDVYLAHMLGSMKRTMQAASAHVFASSKVLVAAGDVASETTMFSSYAAIDSLGNIGVVWQQEMVKTLTPALVSIFEQSANTVVSQVKDHFTSVPKISTEHAEVVITQASNRVSHFSDELWRQARREILLGVQDGESVQSIADRVVAVTQVKEKAAKVIAQTEVIAAVNGGEWSQMMELSSAFDTVMTKEWDATHDSHVRPTHAAADGQVVPLGDKFHVGDAFLNFPGDPSGPSQEVISCRCSTLYDVDVKTKDEGLTAAFNEAEHPRGKNGRFIKKGVGLPGFLLDALKLLKQDKNLYPNVHSTDILTGGEKVDAITEIPNITPKQWANLKDEDKQHFQKLAEDALDEGVPGSAAAILHLEELDEQGDVAIDADEEVFNPATELSEAPKTAPAPTPVPTTTIAKATPIKITHGLIHAKHTPGEVIAQTKVPSGEVRVKWNGKEYEVQLRKSSSASWDNIPSTKVKKSGLYAYLATNFANANWTKPGKQDVEVNTPSINVKPSEVTQQDLESVVNDMLNENWAGAQAGIDVIKQKQSVNPPTLNAPAAVPHPMNAPGPSAPAVSDNAALDMTGWKKISGQKGSNKGGVYEAPDGTQYYVKGQKSKNHANNEVLANALYHAAGVKTPEVRHVKDGTGPWKNTTASKIVTGKSAYSKLTNPSQDPKFTEEAQSGFAVDAWLGNWDVVGAAYDNIIDVNGKPLRIDAGGSLLYRAQGDPKGDVDFGDKVFELKSLKTSWQNANAATVFGSITPEQERESAKKLLSFTDDKIDKMIADAGMDKSLAAKLKKRRDFILDAYGLNKNSDIEVPDVTPAVSAPTPSVGAPTPANAPAPTHIGLSLTEMAQAVAKDFDLYAPGDVVATGKSSKHPNADYRVIMDENGNPSYQYKTPNFDWKENKTPDTFEKVEVKWTVNSPKTNLTENEQDNAAILNLWNKGLITSEEYIQQTGLPAPNASTPTISKNDWGLVVNGAINGEVLATAPGGFKAIYDAPNDTVQIFEGNDYLQTFDASDVENGALESVFPSLDWSTGAISTTSTISHTSEDIISNWSGVIPSEHTPGKTIAHSADGKYTLEEGNTPAWFYLKDANGDHIASYSKKDVQNGDVVIDTGTPTTSATWIVPPAPASGVTPTLNTPASKTGIGHLSWYKKSDFYAYFKEEKVSPAWSGAKIYNSVQVAKMKMAGDPDIAALTDEQMLDLVDEMLKGKSPYGKYSPTEAPYKDKVLAWLKTPNGKKAAIAAKSGGWASGHASVSTPSTLTPNAPSTKKVAAKAASQKLTPADVFGPSLTPDISSITESEQSATFTVFKGSTTGQYFKHKPEEIYWNAVQVGKTKAYTPAQVLALVDAQTTKNNGFSVNGHNYENKIKDWLSTPAGQKKAYEIEHGTWSPTSAKKAAKKAAAYSYGASTYGSSYSGSYDFDASTPYSQKVKAIGDQIEPFNAAKGPSAFPVIPKSDAASLWAAMQAKGSGPITASQKSSLKYYTSNAGYTAMNAYLRGKKGATTATQDHVNKAQEGMRPMPKDVVLHRGSGFFTGWGSYAEIKAREGTIWHEPGFFSASVGGKSAFGGSIAFIIEVPEGTPGALVSSFSNYKSESELFLAAGLKYQLISVDNKGSSTTSGSQVTVRLRVVPDTVVSANVVASMSVSVSND